MIGAHANHYNAHSIGICYEGGLDANGNPADTRTEAQKRSPDFDKMCTYKITYPNFQAFSKNNLCKWVTQRLFFVSLHHVCT